MWLLHGTEDEGMKQSRHPCRVYITSFSKSLSPHISHLSYQSNTTASEDIGLGYVLIPCVQNTVHDTDPCLSLYKWLGHFHLN